jgi:hypothetical protein
MDKLSIFLQSIQASCLDLNIRPARLSPVEGQFNDILLVKKSMSFAFPNMLVG